MDKPLGLILMGGKSRRMGRDKAGLVFHQLPQYLHLNHLLENCGLKALLSLREEQLNELSSDKPYVLDAYGDAGPLGAILSAQDQYPQAAFLVIPCDMPRIDESLLRLLIQNRKPKESQVCLFQHPSNHNPEPFPSIWEASTHSVLQKAVAKGNLGVKKLLQKFTLNQLYQADPHYFLNVNHPEEYRNFLDSELDD